MRTEGEVEFVAEARGIPPRRREVRVSWMVAVPVALGLVVVGVAGARFLMGPGRGVVPGPGGIPVIEPDPEPTKSKPDNPGGMEVPNQDKLVYERLRNAKIEPSVERLLPPEEEPLPRPVVVPRTPDPAIVTRPPTVDPLPSPAPAAAPPVSAPTPAPPPSAAPAPLSTKPAAPPPVEKTAVVPPPAKPTTVAQTVPPPAAKPVEPVKPAATAPGTLNPPAAKTPSVASVPQTQVPAKSSTPGLGGWRVQLASVRTEEEAKGESRRLAAKAAAELGGAALQVTRADLGEKGVYYRVQSGGMDEGTAREACRKLQAQGVGCVLVRP